MSQVMSPKAARPLKAHHERTRGRREGMGRVRRTLLWSELRLRLRLRCARALVKSGESNGTGHWDGNEARCALCHV